MLRHLKLILLFARVSIQDTAAYRVDFLVHVVTAIVHLAGELVAVWIIFSNTRTLAGWSVYESIALLGVFRVMIGGITLFIAPNMRRVMEDIRQGGLDFLLLTPLSSQFYASFRSVVAWRVTDILLGIGLTTYAVIHLGRSFHVGAVASFVVMIAAGVAIIYCFWLILATCAFWFTRISNIEMVFWNIFEAGRYPIDVYSPRIRWGLTYLIPLAFLITFPAGTLLGKPHSAKLGLSIVAAAVAFVLATLFWRLGLRRYSGASA